MELGRQGVPNGSLRTVLKILIGIFVAISLFLGGGIAWRFAAAYLTALRAASACPLRERIASVHRFDKLRAMRDYFERDSRIERREAQLDLWATPAGRVWMPKGDIMLPYIQAEQALRIYGEKHSVQAGDIVLDCGANVGMFTRTALAAGARLVVAIEPAPRTLECLRRNLESEIRDKRVVVYPKGVWDHDDWITLRLEDTNAGGNSMVLSTKGKETVRVPVTTIDQLVAELNLPRVDFIKMDIEGAEKNALEGARNTLAKHRPRMAISSEHLPDDQVRIPELVRRLQPAYGMECGYCTLTGTAVRPQALYFY